MLGSLVMVVVVVVVDDDNDNDDDDDDDDDDVDDVWILLDFLSFLCLYPLMLMLRLIFGGVISVTEYKQ